MENLESIQIFNTAIIKSKEKKISNTYEERLKDICQTPALKALEKALIHLSDSQKISRDQAAVEIVETVRNLDQVWEQYVMMEGIDKLKSLLRNSTPTS
ncbi:MAG: hypothetical protein OXB88_09775 [Bacteriovoracales bacterium]|nr:hypothetical protein [Bacteriovoracales bacterium]